MQKNNVDIFVCIQPIINTIKGSVMNNNLKNVMIVFLFLIAGSLILFVFTESKLLESKNEQAIKEVQTEHRLLIQELEAGSNK